MGRVGVLIFIDDKGPVLTAEFAQNREPTVKVFLQGWTVVEQRECPRNVSITPRFITQTVEGVDHFWRVAVAADIGATGEQ